MDPQLTTPAYERAARLLRDRIYAGVYEVGGKVASAPDLARELGVSVPVIIRAFARLRELGLVRTARGDATYVLPRHQFRVEVTVTGRAPGDVRAYAGRDAAVVSVAVAAAGPDWTWTVVVEAPDPAGALAEAFAVIRSAGGGGLDRSRVRIVTMDAAG